MTTEDAQAAEKWTCRACGGPVEVPLFGQPYALCGPCLDESEGDER